MVKLNGSEQILIVIFNGKIHFFFAIKKFKKIFLIFRKSLNLRASKPLNFGLLQSKTKAPLIRERPSRSIWLFASDCLPVTVSWFEWSNINCTLISSIFFFSEKIVFLSFYRQQCENLRSSYWKITIVKLVRLGRSLFLFLHETPTIDRDQYRCTATPLRKFSSRAFSTCSFTYCAFPNRRLPPVSASRTDWFQSALPFPIKFSGVPFHSVSFCSCDEKDSRF